MLTNELIVLNDTHSKNKSEIKKLTDQIKKTEKERDLTKKNSETVQTALDKLRKERDQMYAIVNSSKYQNFTEQAEVNQEWQAKFEKVQETLNQKEGELN